MKKLFIKYLFIFTVLLVLFSICSFAQNKKSYEAGTPMPNFSLPSLDGSDISVQKMKGKIFVMIFLRGYGSENHDWCKACSYQYAQLVDMEYREKIRKANNMEIVFVLPYGKDEASNFVSKLPDALAEIDKIREAEADKPTAETSAEAQKTRKYYSDKIDHASWTSKTPIPILYDENHVVSKGLGLFQTEWQGVNAPQNIPSIFIIDPEGKIKFKYLAQNTLDRPNAEFLKKYVEKMNMYKFGSN